MAVPALAVETPTVTRRPGGLLSVAAVHQESPRHALGVTYPSDGTCGVAHETPEQCLVGGADNPEDEPKVFDGFDDVASQSLTVYKGIECWLDGSDSYTETARRALDVTGPAALEAQFQTKVLEDSPTEAGADDAPYDVVAGLARLEHLLASTYGGVGLVHVPLGGINFLAEKNLLISNLDGTFSTFAGNRVVVGAGYWPDLASDTFFPIWATSMVHLWPAPVVVSRAPNLTFNLQAALAEQSWAVTLDCPGVYKVYIATGYTPPEEPVEEPDEPVEEP